MFELPIAGGFYRTDSLPLSSQRCVNWEPVVVGTQALSQRVLFDPWGLETYPTTGSIDGVNRGYHKVTGRPYFVNGSTLYSLSSMGDVTDHGEITGSNRVMMADNGQWLVIVVPYVTAYAFNSFDGTLQEIQSDNFRTPTGVTYKDGYFIFSTDDVFFNSELNNPLAYDALDFGAANIDPDNIVSPHTNHNELFILGTETIEVFQNIGGTAFPFQRIPGANIQKGCTARHTIVDFDNTFVFLGSGKNEKPAIWRVTSSQSVEKISTSAIDTEIHKFSEDEINAAFSFTYAYRGNYFCAFTLTSTRIPSKTFVYDATTSALTGTHEWHERQSGVNEGRWRVSGVLDAYGDLIAFDLDDGRIGKLSSDTYSEYGEHVYRERANQPFTGDGLPVFAGELKLTMESGTGLVTGEGSFPEIRLDWSDDGGRTWSAEFPRSYGRQGEYTIYPSWRRQGRFPYHRVIRFKTTEKVKSHLLKLEASAERGAQ